MTIYSRFGDPVTILRIATANDVLLLDGRKPDKTDLAALASQSYLVTRYEDSGHEAVTHRVYLKADGGAHEIDAAIPPSEVPSMAPNPAKSIVLTKSGREVLSKLDTDGACPTSKSTHHRYVSGACIASLLRKGFVRRLPATPGCDGEMYGITNEGRQALKATP